MYDVRLQNIDVVKAAEARILKAFSLSKSVLVSFSGGKDSICTLDLVVCTMKKYGLPFDRLHVVFFDEEAIYPDVEQLTMQWRQYILSIGGHFYWFCLEFKHFNCCNRLSDEETFICWEKAKNDRWVRPMPPFAISEHKLFRKGMSYQQFANSCMKDFVNIVGLRTNESVQRLSAISKIRRSDYNFHYPIYDWSDTDIWMYIRDRKLPFPQTYIYLYKCGVSINKLRISQFFSIDTIKTLPKVLEFYPDLYERIIRREPNADLAILYVGTDMFRSGTVNKLVGVKKDYKAAFNEEWPKACQHPEEYPGFRNVSHYCLPRITPYSTEKAYKCMYQILIAGDPKNRTTRSFYNIIETEKKNGCEER